MAMPHAVSGQPVPLLPDQVGEFIWQATALFKARDLEVMRLMLPAGKILPEHQVAGEITVQCLRGAVDFVCNRQSQRLNAGELLYLDGGVAHGLVGVEDAVLLVTIVLHGAA
ncbi:MAG: cupin domain-containing protein [Burkholderiales bacterium]|nr:cupin domain-containing protein [Burkholderiales bacterium]